jgi:primosomal replication protein N
VLARASPFPHETTPARAHASKEQRSQMSSYNRVILMGNLTRKPEVRYTQSGMAICKVGLAVNRRFKDGQTGDWREEATFIDVTIFGKRGEALSGHSSGVAHAAATRRAPGHHAISGGASRD